MSAGASSITRGQYRQQARQRRPRTASTPEIDDNITRSSEIAPDSASGGRTDRRVRRRGPHRTAAAPDLNRRPGSPVEVWDDSNPGATRYAGHRTCSDCSPATRRRHFLAG